MPKPNTLEFKQKKTDTLIIAGVFFVTRMVIDRFVPFWYNTIYGYWHFLDPEVLHNHLLRGLWNLHSQPPLFNLFLGTVLKISPLGWESHLFALFYFFMGLAITLLSFFIMRNIGISRILSFGAVGIIMLFPSLVKAERWLHYHYPLTLLLVLSFFLLQKFSQKKNFTWFFLLCACLTSIVFLRSFFHGIVWMVPLGVGCLYWVYKNKLPNFGRYVLIFTIFFVLSLSVYLKNFIDYGMFTSSTWQGMNLAAMTYYIPPTDINRMIAQHKITPLANIPAMSAPEVYYAYYGRTAGNGPPELANLKKSTGFPNYNNTVLIQAGKEYEKNSVTLLVSHPAAYAKAVLNEAYLFFGFKPYRYFDHFKEWGVPRQGSALLSVKDILTAYAAPVFMIALFFFALWGFWRNAQVNASSESWLLRSYFIFTVLYVLTVSCLLELKEGCFYRIPIDPLLWIGAAAGFQQLQLKIYG